MNLINNTEHQITIGARPAVVWKFLTDPSLMARWMGSEEMNIDISTDWKEGSPIVIRGFHHIKFENKGVVLAFQPDVKLSYSHLSSLSRLPDSKENYSIITFFLEEIGDQTQIVLQLENFPTETIFKHLDFYWRGTLQHIKGMIEMAQERFET